MSDIPALIERLRDYAKDQGDWLDIDAACEEAADELARLEQERDELREALEQIELYSTEGHVQRRASAALEAKP